MHMEGLDSGSGVDIGYPLKGMNQQHFDIIQQGTLLFIGN